MVDLGNSDRLDGDSVFFSSVVGDVQAFRRCVFD